MAFGWEGHELITMGDRRYEIVRPIRSGGMGTVYLARLHGPQGFQRRVALKSMHARYAADPSFVAMFLDEARATSHLHHPNIVSTLDLIVSTGSDALFLVMDYIEGKSLAEIAEQRRQLPMSIAVAIVHDVLLGLHYAHEAVDEHGRSLSIVHQDVSPQNVMVGIDGFARLVDFGIAKMRRHPSSSTIEPGVEESRGKIAYMAPERLLGRSVGRRADLYSAGVLLWESLTARRLFERTDRGVVAQILTSEIPRPSSINPAVSPALDAVVMRALAREPESRFASALEMADALSRCVALLGRPAIGAFIAEGGDNNNNAVIATPVDVTAKSAPPPAAANHPRSKGLPRMTKTIAGIGIALLGLIVGSTMELGFSRPAFAAGAPTVRRARTADSVSVKARFEAPRTRHRQTNRRH